jgi:hypothetical protein
MRLRSWRMIAAMSSSPSEREIAPMTARSASAVGRASEFVHTALPLAAIRWPRQLAGALPPDGRGARGRTAVR